MSTPVVLPIGHYLGPTTVAADTLASAHRVRVGATTRQLPGGAAYRLWTLAHGLPVPGPGQWTFNDVALESGLGADELGGTLTELAELGLLVVVDPDGPDAVGVARRYGWRSLLTGLSYQDGMFALGLPDEPRLQVDEFLHRVWLWAPVASTLWDACLALTETDDEDDEAPRAMLGALLRRLHLLLAGHAGYLDEVA